MNDDEPSRDTNTYAYTIVINNWTENDKQRFIDEPSDYKCYAEEVGDSGTPHLQCYIYKKSKIRFSAIKKRNPRANFRVSLGTSIHNRTYIFGPWTETNPAKPKKSKPANDTAIEIGTLPEQGKRTDLTQIIEKIKTAETSVDEITMTQPAIYHQYGRTLHRVEDLLMRKKFRNTMTTCDWIYGATGVGKSHLAFKDYNPATHYKLNLLDGGWWEGYTQQDIVIINEFRGQIQYGELLELIDKWVHNVKRRNREPMPFTSKHIIITSSMPPQEIYKNLASQDKIEQLLDRVNIIHLKGNNKRKDLKNNIFSNSINAPEEKAHQEAQSLQETPSKNEEFFKSIEPQGQ
jgi:hypothetical protein